MYRKLLACLAVLSLAVASIGLRNVAHSAATAPACDSYSIPFYVGHSTTSQSLSSGTLTVLAPDTTDCDSYSNWGSANNRYNVGTGEDGYYQVNGATCFDPNSDTSRRLLQFRLNGSGGPIQSSVQVSALNSGSFSTCLVTTSMVHLVGGDYIQLVGTQASGGNLSVQQTRFSVQLFFADTH